MIKNDKNNTDASNSLNLRIIISNFTFLQKKENIEKKGFKKYHKYEKEYKEKLGIKDYI